MRIVHQLCCGLDVHKRTVTACLLQMGASGQRVTTIRTFVTTTPGLRELVGWLQGAGCQHVAMESTGVYWKPVFNLLEPVCQEVLLVNAQHVKNVPGRKTDVKDAQWIAELLAHGLLKASFIPPQEIRELRELTRYRQKLVKQRADQCNRIQKLLETANIKLASVVTDVLGVSGRAMLRALADGATDVEKMADLAHQRLRKKIPQLREALQGHLTDTQRWLLKEQLQHVAQLEERIGCLNEKIEELCRPFEPLIAKLVQIPGVSRRIAQIIIAEIGIDMQQFGDAPRLCSWAGMCPGNHESAGKKFSGKRRKGSVWLRAALSEAGWAASRKKDSYLSSQYRNLSRRRGKRRAVVAVGHSILTISFHLLSDPAASYQDLGANHYVLRDKDRLVSQLLRRLGKLGYTVTITAAA